MIATGLVWWERRSRCACERSIVRINVVVELFFLDSISVNMLVVTLQLSFAKYYHCGKLGKEYMKPVHYFLKLPGDLQVSQNFKKYSTSSKSEFQENSHF